MYFTRSPGTGTRAKCSAEQTSSACPEYAGNITTAKNPRPDIRSSLARPFRRTLVTAIRPGDTRVACNAKSRPIIRRDGCRSRRHPVPINSLPRLWVSDDTLRTGGRYETRRGRRLYREIRFLCNVRSKHVERASKRTDGEKKTTTCYVQFRCPYLYNGNMRAYYPVVGIRGIG